MKDDVEFIDEMENKVDSGAEIRLIEAERLLNTSNVQILAETANRIARKFSENSIDVEMLPQCKIWQLPRGLFFLCSIFFL